MTDLATPADLADFPGAPFADTIVRAASESVRGDCGWHIAPEVTETIVLDSPGGAALLLPSLKVTTVSAAKDLTGDTPRDLSGWRVSQVGVLHLPGGWPAGYGAVEVTLTHGHVECPPELLAVIAERCQRTSKDLTVAQESLGSRSASYRETVIPSSVLARYKVTGAP